MLNGSTVKAVSISKVSNDQSDQKSGLLSLQTHWSIFLTSSLKHQIILVDWIQVRHKIENCHISDKIIVWTLGKYDNGNLDKIIVWTLGKYS